MEWTQESFFSSEVRGQALNRIDVKDFAIVFGGALQGTLVIPPNDRIDRIIGKYALGLQR